MQHDFVIYAAIQFKVWGGSPNILWCCLNQMRKKIFSDGFSPKQLFFFSCVYLFSHSKFITAQNYKQVQFSKHILAALFFQFSKSFATIWTGKWHPWKSIQENQWKLKNRSILFIIISLILYKILEKEINCRRKVKTIFI